MSATYHTLTYSDGVKGWPSFYTFYPDWMLGSNNYFYTWKAGQLWRHNVNEERSTFYGTMFPSWVETVLNASPIEPKLFKTLSLAGSLPAQTGLPPTGFDNSWGAWVTTPENLSNAQQMSQFILGDEWEIKEGHYFSYLKRSGADTSNAIFSDAQTLHTNQLTQRSCIGIGEYEVAEVENPAANEYRINMAEGWTPPLSLSIGEFISTQYTVGTDSWNLGVITALGYNDDPASAFIGRPQIYIDANPSVTIYSSPAQTPLVSTTRFLYTVGNPVVESMGMLGDYLHIRLSINTNSPFELFSVNSETMKSNP